MYILEGNIGVGKSTFLKLMSEQDSSIKVVQEPLEGWTDVREGQSLLDSFYKDPHRWSYTIETLTMMSRSKEHIKEQQLSNPNRIMERSIYSGHYCFSLCGKEEGYFTDIEWTIYLKWIKFFFQKECAIPDGFIYLQAHPDICFERIKKRGRICEAKLAFDYVNKIHIQHEKFLVKKEGIFIELKKVPVLILDGSKDFESDPKILKDYLKQTKNFICRKGDKIDVHHKRSIGNKKITRPSRRNDGFERHNAFS